MTWDVADGQGWSWRGTPEGPEALVEAQAGLTVAAILTPRSKFVTCRTNQTLADAIRGHEIYDHLPVVELRVNDDPMIVRMLPTERLQTHSGGELVETCMLRLDERWFVGSTMSVLDFVRRANEYPCRLVVDGGHIVGLASISDMQKLPVRAALFGLIIGFEMAMAEVITRTLPGETWMRYLSSEKRRKNIEARIRKARDSEGFISELLVTDLADKIAVMENGCWANVPDLEARKTLMKRVLDLRNKIAHAKDYAQARRDAYLVCEIVRDLVSLAFQVHKETTIGALQ
jgi:hypothetical protein